MRNVWRLTTDRIDPEADKEARRRYGLHTPVVMKYGEPGPIANWMRKHERIALGWGEIGDIREQGYDSVKQLKAAIRRTYPQPSQATTGALCLWSFYAEMQKGDLVILDAMNGLVLVVKIAGDYEWTSEKPEFVSGQPCDYQHSRLVQSSAWSPRALSDAVGGYAKGHSWRLFLARYEHQIG